MLQLATLIVAVEFAVAGFAGGEGFSAPALEQTPQSIDAWLLRLDQVAALYRDKALSFSCRETIVWNQTPGADGRATFDYIYAYNDRSGGLEEQRTLPGDAGKEGASQDVRPEAAGVPRYLRSGMLWPLIFQKSR